ncbi:MAG: hypothetical protein H3C64_12780 [Candidatus Kuenenia stuttgartiensis]|uniref:hypothetical protein n=1 Tax=Candidatus Kuenenia TaxID=380738 RepID=UPI0012FEA364|nr:MULTISPECIES: hypothetical protein [Kuenenia]MBE7548323.1 hypothetical protein [Planctomycetia bacterium]MBW7943227.1 hypothetical protein [Candidatus Kuenenia stuttgartiensis]MBZ0192745.1 hypothetical protein [Candidatus Kuenenia stuttgartiensis]MCL4726804.1 hypothetical protein [Candidatus Kuenenia stuttgartiensis]MCZ7621018.1 hypothetical protein [Candidatus Kuenenia sp.]
MNAINTMAGKPVIGVITGYLNASNSLPGKEMNADFVIKEPFELEEVLRSVNDSLKD